MPRGLMDDLEGEVIGEEVYEAVLKFVLVIGTFIPENP